jgi:hypothetical protein
VQSPSLWITGPTRSGKTSRLIEQFCQWVTTDPTSSPASQPLSKLDATPAYLVFTASGLVELVDRITQATEGQYPVQATTPLRFFRDEVTLFWPLLIQQLNLRAQFPLRLRPETEQELATRLWQPALEAGLLQQTGISEYRLVRRTLDLLQLAGASGVPVEDIPQVLAQGNGTAGMNGNAASYNTIGELLVQWQQWCLERGFLTYGIICELYWRHLLTHPVYQQHLTRRYRAVFADDVDEYPAITRWLFEFLLDHNIKGAFTYNPQGAVRLGLDADPDYLAGLATRCRVKRLKKRPVPCLSEVVGDSALELVLNSYSLEHSSLLPNSVKSIQTTARSQLLRNTAQEIIQAIESGEVEPQDIAVITPGLDAIARYSLMEILSSRGIPVAPLNEQRPLASSPMIRGLLTLLGLVYPGLGRLVERDGVAEMLVVLSQQPQIESAAGEPTPIWPFSTIQSASMPVIDPVRAGLIVDHCFYPDLEHPRLLPVNAFPRWDRLGYRATNAYQELLEWLAIQKTQLEQRLIPGPVAVLDRAIQQFLWKGGNLPVEQLTALRELIFIAQHYWQVDGRLRQIEPDRSVSVSETVGQFIGLLRRGQISSNPYPGLALWPAGGAVTLGTIFQYRFNHLAHRWHFWLDAGSPLWLSTGEAVRFGAPLFLKQRSGQAWTTEDALHADEERLQRILLDLLSRAGERLYLCHSDLAVNGQEQTGPLLSLVNMVSG